MIEKYDQLIDLKISHHQIHVYCGSYDEDKTQWGDINVDQGAILHDSHLIFDPIVDGAFKAKVYINKLENFVVNEAARRGIRTNFVVLEKRDIFLSSVPESCIIEINLNPGLYVLYFEECEYDEIDELFFVLTFIETKNRLSPIYIIDDPWGGKIGKELFFGNTQ
jgi:hypothetical protein